MKSWIDELRENIATECGDKPVVVTLATVRANGSADARSVVVRNFSNDGRMLITSDARSEKNQQLKLNPSATVVFWLPILRKQFRIAGKVTVLPNTDPLRLQTWQKSSDSARALFSWPPPGQPRRDGEFVKSVGMNEPMPESFEVLQLSPARADVLDLNQHPHLRVNWHQQSGVWESSIINP